MFPQHSSFASTASPQLNLLKLKPKQFQLRQPVSRRKKLKLEQTTKHGQLRGDSPKQLRPVLRVLAQSDQMRTFPAKLVGIRDFPNANLAYSGNLQGNCHDVSIPSRPIPRRNVCHAPALLSAGDASAWSRWCVNVYCNDVINVVCCCLLSMLYGVATVDAVMPCMLYI